MNHLNPRRTGLALGYLFGGVHLLWAIAIGLGWGQLAVDFMFWAHMIHLPITVGPFDMSAAVTLIIVTFVAGYVLGYAFARIWNRVHR